MKEYLLLFRGGERPEMVHSAEQAQGHMLRWRDWMGKIAQAGNFVSAQPLTESGKQIKGTKKIVTDGPFMEGKEMVGGYLICKANSYDEAIELSKGCPILEYDDGIVEVREVQELKM